MGIIIKQSIQGSIWSYLGLIVGYINLGVIMPNILESSQIGLIQIFAAFSVIFAQLSTLGFTSVTNRLFPLFRNQKNGHNGFLFLTIITGILGFILSVIAFLILKPHIIESNIEKSPLLVEYLYLLIPLVFFRLLFNLLDTYNKVLFDAVTGTFWNEFGHKIINLLLILLYAFNLIGFNQFFFGFIFSLSMPAIPIIFVLIKRGNFNIRPKFKFLSKSLVKEVLVVSSFGIISGFSGILVPNIDKILVNQYLSLDEVGIFTVCALFATVIKIPFQSISKIATGIIAEAWNNNDKTSIQDIYSKASINQMIIGTLLFVGLLVNLEAIFIILPPEYSSGKMVLIIYAIGILINTTNALSATIISTSNYYKVLTYIMLVTTGLTIGTNMLLIPIWGINGAAIATSSTLIIGSLIRIIFLKYKYGLWCYGIKHLVIIIIAAVIVLLSYLIPKSDNWIINMIIVSLFVTVFYGILIWVLRISNELNNIVENMWNTINKQKK